MKRPRPGAYRPDSRIDALSNESLVALRTDLGARINVAVTEQRVLRAEIARITGVLRGRAEPPFKVSDHAVVRWLERVQGFDIEAVRAEIVARVAAAQAEGAALCDAQGASVEIAGGGLVFVVTHDRTVATLYPSEQRERGVP